MYQRIHRVALSDFKRGQDPKQASLLDLGSPSTIHLSDLVAVEIDPGQWKILKDRNAPEGRIVSTDWLDGLAEGAGPPEADGPLDMMERVKGWRKMYDREAKRVKTARRILRGLQDWMNDYECAPVETFPAEVGRRLQAAVDTLDARTAEGRKF